ncbi:hypothetical protein [Pseudonocardia abyssalis]|jgi:hypothetical protein|uniref:Uncharacterized protein n=1 Tax=Pseudonocardia abyssalis TaxID=2792008 RepID=A0ABS6UVS8_9PSEU|nr:hypothetical protein [Pseudonocardia abyssalis]MBW0136350.1 hypothetical protein [Pseudonocardia abyssalis]
MSECYDPAPIDTTTPAQPDIEDGTFGYVDLDGDGYTETTQLDTNGDGTLDTVLVDVDGDFYDDLAAFDNTPGDGTFTADVIALGFDADGLADVVLDDTDLDGIFETTTPGADEPLPYANPYETSAGVAPLGQIFAPQS